MNVLQKIGNPKKLLGRDNSLIPVLSQIPQSIIKFIAKPPIKKAINGIFFLNLIRRMRNMIKKIMSKYI
jgi:hypothetical protein